ncbi:MAG: M6 family metalloprotease domain-containing protein, partial [Candidatus Cloacimonetes bacterium]|nr:M6 family metalloprotease domain-containing protein [Candidatus Cloacimonadota bacterium]
DSRTRFYCWARQGEDGELESTGFPIHLHDPKDLGLEPGETISPERRRLRSRNFPHNDNIQGRSDSRNTPSIGDINQVVIFVRFSDDTEFPSLRSEYEELFNGFAPGQNSLKRYFYDTSYEQLTINSHLYPISGTANIISYQSPSVRDYFQPYDIDSNKIGYIDDPNVDEIHRESRARIIELIRGAVNHVSNQIDPQLCVDYDNNGYVDNLVLVLRGSANPASTVLWPHCWVVLESDSLFINNKRIWRYNINIEEKILSPYYGVGVLAHEFAHSMGIPDLYHYDYESSLYPVDKWDLMAYPLNPPQSMTAYIKYKYTDWMGSRGIYNIPEISLDIDQTYTIKPLWSYAANDTVAVRYRTPNMSADEYIVIENRVKPPAPAIDSNLPSSGLLIYRVRYDQNGNIDSSTNKNAIYFKPFEVYVYRPGGKYNDAGSLIIGDINDAVFPSNEKTMFTNYTDPVAFASNGEYIDITLANIEKDINNDNISFDFHITYPEIFITKNTMYGLGQAIEWLKHEGTIYFLPDITPAWNPTYYNIHEPIHVYGKAITLQNFSPVMGNIMVEFLYPTSFKDIYTKLTLRDIFVESKSDFDLYNTDVDLHYAHLSIFSDTVALSSFVGNSEVANNFNFIVNPPLTSGLWAQGLTTLYITGYNIDQTYVNEIPPAVINIDSGRIQSPGGGDFPIILTNEIRNFPNPFNPETTLSFTISNSTNVKIDIYNIRGQKIITLVDSFFEAGNHEYIWNGTDEHGRTMASGVYLYRMLTDDFTQIRRMLLLK